MQPQVLELKAANKVVHFGGKALVSSFKYSYCLFTGNSGKVYEEFLKRRRTLQIIEQILHRDARARKAQSSAHDFGVSPDECRVHTHLQFLNFSAWGVKDRISEANF